MTIDGPKDGSGVPPADDALKGLSEFGPDYDAGR